MGSSLGLSVRAQLPPSGIPQTPEMDNDEGNVRASP